MLEEASGKCGPLRFSFNFLSTRFRLEEYKKPGFVSEGCGFTRLGRQPDSLAIEPNLDHLRINAELGCNGVSESRTNAFI